MVDASDIAYVCVMWQAYSFLNHVITCAIEDAISCVLAHICASVGCIW